MTTMMTTCPRADMSKFMENEFTKTIEENNLLKARYLYEIAGPFNPDARIGKRTILCTGLFLAAKFMNPDMAEWLLKLGADVNKLNEVNETALIRACLRGQNTKVVKLLLEAGANPNIIDDHGDTPLLRAYYIGSGETMDLLIKHGADLDLKGGKREKSVREIMKEHEASRGEK